MNSMVRLISSELALANQSVGERWQAVMDLQLFVFRERFCVEQLVQDVKDVRRKFALPWIGAAPQDCEGKESLL